MRGSGYGGHRRTGAQHCGQQISPVHIKSPGDAPSSPRPRKSATVQGHENHPCGLSGHVHGPDISYCLRAASRRCSRRTRTGSRPQSERRCTGRKESNTASTNFPAPASRFPIVCSCRTPGRRNRSCRYLITLRAGNSINNNHRAGNDLVKVARERGYIVISPLGFAVGAALLRQPLSGRSGSRRFCAGGWLDTAGQSTRGARRAVRVESGGRGIQRRYVAGIPSWAESGWFRSLSFRRAISGPV